MQLSLELEAEEIDTILKALRNEAARLSIVNRGGSGAVDRFADQIEAAIRKPVQREAVPSPKKTKRA